MKLPWSSPIGSSSAIIKERLNKFNSSNVNSAVEAAVVGINMRAIWLITIVVSLIAAFYLGGRFQLWLEYDDEIAAHHRMLIPLAIAGLVLCLYLSISG